MKGEAQPRVGLISTVAAVFGGRPIFAYGWFALFYADILVIANATRNLGANDRFQHDVVGEGKYGLLIVGIVAALHVAKHGLWSLVVVDPNSSKVDVSLLVRALVWGVVFLSLYILVRYGLGGLN